MEKISFFQFLVKSEANRGKVFFTGLSVCTYVFRVSLQFDCNYSVFRVFSSSMCHCVYWISLGSDSLLSNTCSPASSTSRSSSLPEMAGDGEGVHAHAHRFRGDGTKLLPV